VVGYFVDCFVWFGIEDVLFVVGVMFGVEVFIGCGDDVVVFDWEFMMVVGVELFVGFCGIDLCIGMDDVWLICWFKCEVFE